LPAFVIAREFVSQVLAMLPWRLLARAQRGTKTLVSIRYRLLMAVTVAVAVVAVGASLSVDAQLRTNHLVHRRELAHSLSRLLAESGSDAALEQEIRQNGFTVRDEESTGEPIEHPELPLVESIARPPLTLLSFLGPTLFMIVLSAAIGFVIGDRIARDLSQAARDVDLLGTRDILRGGTRVAAPARFVEVVALGSAIDEVATRFGEFAAGKERMIEAKESAQRLRDLFLASMSHDLRSPLNSVLGFIEILRKGALTAAQMESMDIIERRGRELLDLIGNILDAAKIEAGHLELTRDWVFPSEIVWNAVTRGRELAEEKLNAGGALVQVQGELQAGIEPLYVDGPRLTQAVVNLVANAVKFMDSGVVRVRLTSDPQKQGVRIEVADQGHGIPEPEVAKIFDAFHQPMRSRRYGGLGLGLSLTRAFVALHSGTIEVNSSSERGSVFTLLLPLVSPDQVPPSRKYMSEAPGFEEQTVKMPALDTTRG
jgi:signal transduction histidine kinase